MRQIISAIVALACMLVALSCSAASGTTTATRVRGDDVSQTLSDGGVLVARGEEVLLLPSIEAGSVGWCMMTVDASGGSGCGHVRSRAPIVDENWGSGGLPPMTEGTALTTSQVVAVSVEGSAPIPTRAESALPGGLRAVVIEIRGKELPEGLESIPRFTPLNTNGAPIPESTVPGRPLAVEFPTRRLRPARLMVGEGTCRISAGHLRGLIAQKGRVVTQVRPSTGLIGRAFISCASTEYSLGHWRLLAGILIDASHPGSTPGPLPAMKPVPEHREVFQAPGDESNLVARRIPGAWLVVLKGSGLQQRLTLLKRLSATVRL